jgi:hypothetical protein
MDTLLNFFTPKELAARWGMSPGTLANWRLEGKGPHFEKKGWLICYPKRLVYKWERENPRYAEKARSSLV